MPGPGDCAAGGGEARGTTPPAAADADALPAGAIARLGSPGRRHTGWVHGVAFVGDGRRLLAGDDRGFLIEWDVATGRRLRRSRPFASAPNPAVYAVAVSADGKTTAVGGSDGAVALTSAGGNRTLTLDVLRVTVLALTPDGRVCAAGGQRRDGGGYTVRFFDTAAGRERGRVACKEQIDSFALDAAGKFCAVLQRYGKMVRLFDAEAEKPAGTLEAGWIPFADVALAPDGKTAATTGQDSQLRFWDVATCKEIRRAKEANWHFQVAYLPDGKVVAPRYDGRFAVLDPATGAVLRLGESLSIRGDQRLVVSPDGRAAAVVSTQVISHAVDVYDLAAGKPRRYAGHRDHVSALAFSADGKALFSAGSDQVLRRARRSRAKGSASPAGSTAPGPSRCRLTARRWA